MAKNKISPEVREARAMNMRRLHLKRLVAAGKADEAAAYAKQHRMLVAFPPTMPEPEVNPTATIAKAQATITGPGVNIAFTATAAPHSNVADAGTTPLVIESKPVLSPAAQDRLDFQRQIDADIAAELEAEAPTIKITPTVPVVAPVPVAAAQAPDVPQPKPPTDLDFADTGTPAKAPPPPVARPALPWPDRTTGEIIAQCPNPALVILRIADGRRTTMFNYGVRPWQIGAKVRVKINQRRGPEAIYETDWAKDEAPKLARMEPTA